MRQFANRFDAAYQLVPLLEKYTGNSDAIIIAIPRGGLELGYVLARELQLPLEVVLTKKIGFPGNPEYAIGAVSLEHVDISPEFIQMPELEEYIAHQIIDVRKLLHERNILYRGNKPPISLMNKVVIVVDDGVATGSTLLATLVLIKKNNPLKIIVALPVASPGALRRIRAQVDELICLEVPIAFMSVGQFYSKFDQVNDSEAIRLLHEANEE
jgi:putative phosphoribosyl transferase